MGRKSREKRERGKLGEGGNGQLRDAGSGLVVPDTQVVKYQAAMCYLCREHREVRVSDIALPPGVRAGWQSELAEFHGEHRGAEHIPLTINADGPNEDAAREALQRGLDAYQNGVLVMCPRCGGVGIFPTDLDPHHGVRFLNLNLPKQQRCGKCGTVLLLALGEAQEPVPLPRG